MTESTESIEQRLRTHFSEEGAAAGDGIDAALHRIHAGARGRRVRRDLRRTTIAPRPRPAFSHGRRPRSQRVGGCAAQSRNRQNGWPAGSSITRTFGWG